MNIRGDIRILISLYYSLIGNTQKVVGESKHQIMIYPVIIIIK